MIKKTIRNLLVPTPENENLPLILSYKGFIITLIIGLVTLSPIIYTQSKFFASIIPPPKTFQEKDVISLVNQSREVSGLNRLQESPQLNEAARKKAEDIFRRQYFSHVTPDGMQPWYFLETTGYHYAAAGENLAKSFVMAEDAHRAFMVSPGHRANILSPLYTELGVFVKSGVLNQEPTIVVVQFFGQPRVIADTTPPPTTIIEQESVVQQEEVIQKEEVVQKEEIIQQEEKTTKTDDQAIIISEANEYLKLGSRGEEVAQLQKILSLNKEIYPEGLITGYFGPLTQKAVLKFQEAYSIEETAGPGIVGPTTTEKISEFLENSSKIAVLGDQFPQSSIRINKPIDKDKIEIMIIASALLGLILASYAIMSMRTKKIHLAATLRTGFISIFLASAIIFGNYHSIIIPEINTNPYSESSLIELIQENEQE